MDCNVDGVTGECCAFDGNTYALEETNGKKKLMQYHLGQLTSSKEIDFDAEQVIGGYEENVYLLGKRNIGVVRLEKSFGWREMSDGEMEDQQIMEMVQSEVIGKLYEERLVIWSDSYEVLGRTGNGEILRKIKKILKDNDLQVVCLGKNPSK